MSKQSTYEICWKNFKGFKDTGWVKIKPVTILIGPNNSGKSSFTAPLLLMSQTVTSRDSSSAIIVKGCTYDGGNIKELMTDYDLTEKLYLGFRYDQLKPESGKLKKVGTYAPGSFEVVLGINNEQDREIVICEEVIKDVFNRNYLTIKKGKNDKYSISGIDVNKMSDEEKMAIQNCLPMNFLFTPEGLISSLLKERGKLDEKKKVKGFSSEFSELLRVISYNTSRLTEILSDLSFIGPIRENPHRVYEVSNESYNTVGHKGENMPNLLKKYKDKFGKELNYWIRKFDFGDSLEFKLLYGNLYSIRFREKNKEKYTSIANAGFGASQLLPLIIQALVAPKDSITIAEQPEIHLNPKLQCVLADLFAYMAKNKRFSIIETHSEHLLLRLRLLIANKTISTSDVAVYFIEKQDGYSNIKQVMISEDGSIDQNEWPSDFFADTLRESMALASEQLKLNKN